MAKMAIGASTVQIAASAVTYSSPTRPVRWLAVGA
jgi:hypothetical protein